MRKMILLVLSLTFMSAILFGCQSKDNAVLQSDGKITMITVSKSSGFGKVNSDASVVFVDNENLETLRGVFSSTVKVEGMADITKPEFDLEVHYINGDTQGLHLWIGERGQISTLMNIDNTGTIYSVSEEMTGKLINLLR